MNGDGKAAHARDVEAAQQTTILVVEDEVLVRLAVADYLRDSGMQVIEAANADEAVRVLEAEQAIQLVFSDVNMPGRMDGNALARWLQRARPAVRIILTSGAGWRAGDVVANVPRLTKPYYCVEVERLIRSLLEQC